MKTNPPAIVGPNSDYSAQSKILSMNHPSLQYSITPPTHRLTAFAPPKSFELEAERDLANFGGCAQMAVLSITVTYGSLRQPQKSPLRFFRRHTRGLTRSSLRLVLATRKTTGSLEGTCIQKCSCFAPKLGILHRLSVINTCLYFRFPAFHRFPLLSSPSLGMARVKPPKARTKGNKIRQPAT
jgi:hypothetical protein